MGEQDFSLHALPSGGLFVIGIQVPEFLLQQQKQPNPRNPCQERCKFTSSPRPPVHPPVHVRKRDNEKASVT